MTKPYEGKERGRNLLDVTVLPRCRSGDCFERLRSKTTEVMAVSKDRNQRLPMRPTVIKDCRSDSCLERL